MNRKIRAHTEFIYHNVGQGLFYSGEINYHDNHDNSKFRFIYDCGSEKPRLVNTSIRRFKQDVGYNEIDLLVISHLHSDHVSGLNELFNNFGIKDVILPYFSPIERLLTAVRGVNIPLWYYEFLSDPVKYLIGKGVKRVIIVGGEEGGEGGIPPEEISPAPTKSGLKISKLPDDEKLKRKINENEENWNKYLEDGKLLIKNHNGYALALGLWLFRFFNYKITPSGLQQLNSCVKQVTGNRDIRNAIRNKDSLRKLKRCYHRISRQLSNDFNNTSLVLYHGPIGSNYINAHSLNYCEYRFLVRCPFLYDRGFLGEHNKFGQFLTGDIDLNTRYDDLINHYTRYLRSVMITQVPHHGAIRNWNGRIINDAPDTELWVIPAGITNRYGHPSYRLIENLYFNRGKCIWVNEINFLIIRGEVTW